MKQADAQHRPSCALLGEVLVGTSGSNNKGYRWRFCHGLAYFVSTPGFSSEFPHSLARVMERDTWAK